MDPVTLGIGVLMLGFGSYTFYLGFAEKHLSF